MPDVNWLGLNAPDNLNLLFVFNRLMKSCHSNKKTQFGYSYVTDDVITVDLGRYFMANVFLLWSDSLLRIKLLKL